MARLTHGLRITRLSGSHGKGDKMSAIGKLNLNGTGYEFATPTDEQTQTAVNAWLDDHPEATTTVQDGSITAAKLYSPDFKPINVLSLGVKNDGTEDISVIVNEATRTNALYFPAGLYRVDHEIRLVNSIYGVGYNRRYNTDPEYTEFISNITGTSTDAVIRVVGPESTNLLRGIVIQNIDIHLYTNECGIIINTADQETVYINGVGIKDIRDAFGIWCNPTTSTSRMMFVDNCTLYGAYGLPASTGIKIEASAFDNRITNTEIVAVQRGLWVIGNILYLSNVHIWTGCRAGHDSNDWWSNTVSIDASTDLINAITITGTNVYLDSSHHFIETWRGNTINLTNVLAWMDNSMNGTTATDGEFCYTRGEIVEKNVQIVNMVARLRGRIPSVMSAAVSYTNIKMVNETGDDFTNYSDWQKYPITSWLANNEFDFYDHNATNTYIEIARAPMRWAGKMAFNFTSQYDDVDFWVSRDDALGIKIRMSQSIGTANFYYIWDSNARMLYIYRKRYSNDVMQCHIRVIEENPTNGLLNYSAVRVFPRQALASDTGLTQIVAKMQNENTIQIDAFANFAATISNIEIGKTYNVYIASAVVSAMSQNKVSGIGKGFCAYLQAGAIDFFLGCGGDMYLIRTDEAGTPSRVRKMTSTSL